MYEKARAKLLPCQSKPIVFVCLFFFLPLSLPSPVSLLNLPICFFFSGRSVGNWPKSSGTSLS